MAPANPIVEFRGLSKSFGKIRANHNLNLKIEEAHIHAIVGENGAGKSTAMKLLYGTYQPDSGEILIRGNRWGGRDKPWSSPRDAILMGIGMVHQHFMLSDEETVLDNILLGLEPFQKKWKWMPRSLRPIDREKGRERLEALSRQYGLSVNLDARVSDLPVGIQQRIEILRLLYLDAEILILDEPTAVLTPMEIEELFVQLRKLSAQGKTIILITHKLREVMNLSDRVTVFRGGTAVAERARSETSIEDLASLMVGRKMNLFAQAAPSAKVGEPVLQFERVTFKGRRNLEDLSFEVRTGEIVGIAGVEGNGQTELIQLLFHPKDFHHQTQGTIRILGKDHAALSTAQIKALGVGLVPEDRHKEGLLLDRPLRENFLLGLQRQKRFKRMGFISEARLDIETKNALEEYDIRPRIPELKARKLSGGNQQKLIIAREMNLSPQLMVVAHPTRGVDVGAIETIHQRLFKARDQGKGILLISSELDEILELADRILVLFAGRIVGEFKRGEATEQMLGLRMGGALK